MDRTDRSRKRPCRLRFLVVAALVAAATLAAAPARAQVHTHDGFFLRMDLGVGGMASRADVGPSEVEFSGGAGEFSIAVGGAVAENLILAGHLWGASTEDPAVKVDGHDIGDANGTLSLSGLGLNVTYYLMPANVYFSVTPSLTTLSLESRGRTYDTDRGFGLHLAVGKEWWVSDNWGLGLNGQVAVSGNEDAGDTWTTAWVGIAFSATFN